MQPEEFIEFAKRLLNDPAAPEANLRQAAHAAYYGVYHLVCAHFRIDPTSRAVATHRDVRTRLRGLNPADVPVEIKEAKRVTERLFALRCSADYDLKVAFTAEDAEDAVEMAKGVFAKKEKLAEMPKQAVTRKKEEEAQMAIPMAAMTDPTAQSPKA